MTGVEIVRRPARRSLLVSAVAGSVATSAAAVGSPAGALVCLAGTGVLVAGVATARHGLVDAGGLVAFLGVVFAAANGATAGPVVVGTAATVVAWDAGGNAVSLGRQLGSRVDSLRVELLHAVAGAVVGLTTALVGLVLFRLGPTRQPVTTLFVLLLAAVLLVVALNR